MIDIMVALGTRYSLALCAMDYRNPKYDINVPYWYPYPGFHIGTPTLAAYVGIMLADVRALRVH